MPTDPPCQCGHAASAHSRRYFYCLRCEAESRAECWRYVPASRPQIADPGRKETPVDQDQYDVLLMRLRTIEVGIQEVLRRTRTLERVFNEELVHVVANLCRSVERIETTLERDLPHHEGDEGGRV